jgi:hypothetical protein
MGLRGREENRENCIMRNFRISITRRILRNQIEGDGRLGRYVAGSLSHWPRGLRRGSAAVRLLGLRVRIPLEAWMSVCCECCALSGRGLCVGLVPRPEESYRVWCVQMSVIVKPR